MIKSTFNIQLTPTKICDLETLYQFQLDIEAAYLAAFMPNDSTNKTAYIIKYTKLLANPTVKNFTIIIDNTIVGSIATFIIENLTHITYWIDKKYWGKGIATAALKNLLLIEASRPIFASVAFDNYSSQKVLEKCGFIKTGVEKGFANARQAVIEEFTYKLN